MNISTNRTIRRNVLVTVACLATAFAAMPAAGASAELAQQRASHLANNNAPIGKFPGVHLTLSRWSGDPWTSEQQAAAAQWDKASETFAGVVKNRLKNGPWTISKSVALITAAA